VASNVEVRSIISSGEQENVHRKAQEYLKNNKVLSAMKLLLAE